MNFDQTVRIESILPHVSKGIANRKLKSSWTVWSQKKDINENDWMQNVIPIYEFNSSNEFWYIYYNLDLTTEIKYIFMRDKIHPKWEDKHNINGGYYCINIPEIDKSNIFKTCLSGMIGETLTKKRYNSNHITGMTFVSNKNKSHIRIWIDDSHYQLKKDNLSKEYVAVFNKINAVNDNDMKFVDFKRLIDKQNAVNDNNIKFIDFKCLIDK
uniref:Uncharacterized protein n=1 Tax=viral metagenome TaxID=1070528 RepID=A0A6C0LRV3_9ZZZZ